ncbi:uncharacterized protein LOC109848103 isoform X2 [Asparagus officinalis]|nr:uncharacterized protein LOC109848103 isoform X2 [Asparagus officinalis]XP_020273020.1 uncharacterized protein LOC109848103 isoform X2 [Asparagus officinalis]
MIKMKFHLMRDVLLRIPYRNLSNRLFFPRSLDNHYCNPFMTKLFFKHQYNEEDPLIRASSSSGNLVATTTVNHIVFAISASAKGWPNRGPYVDLWWRPNQTRGVVWLDKAPEYPWPSTSPPFRVSEDTSRFKEYDKHNNPSTIRAARMILETFKLGFEDVRWFVKADDDTLVIIDNLVDVLAKYDHNRYYYIGGNSECVAQNDMHAFNMAFGGAGIAVSYPLAKALAKNLDGCLKRYPFVYGEDHVIQSCMTELGVSVTKEPGFHQIDLHGDVSGFLSAHPQAPLVTLHHLDIIDPIFPSMSRYEAVHNFMRAAMVESPRLLQQIIGYDQQKRWSVSISWGYSVHIYEELHSPGYLQRPLQTFSAWNKRASPPFMFNVRPLSNDSCSMPHVFYFESVRAADLNQTVTSYIRRTAWELSSCGNHSVKSISEVEVFTPAKRLQWGVERRECCEIESVPRVNIIKITVRACRENETLIWSHLS